jgi:hypothetical protein
MDIDNIECDHSNVMVCDLLKGRTREVTVRPQKITLKGRMTCNVVARGVGDKVTGQAINCEVKR